MKRILLWACWVLSCIQAGAQSKAVWKHVFEKINTEVLAHSQAYANLRQATAGIGHRLTGTANGEQAEAFAYKLLQSYGLQVRYQPFEAEGWRRGSVALQAGPDSGHLKPLKAVALAHTPVHARVQAPLADMGNGLEEDYAADPAKVKDKIALVYLGVLPGSKAGTPMLHRSEKTALAIHYGAKAVVFINTAAGGVLLTGTASVTGKLIGIPAVCIGLEDGLALKAKLAVAPQVAAIDMRNFSEKIRARNVIATLKGSSLPNEKIVIGGHLDSWDLATGAIDNGIGAFSVLDIARSFATLKLRPARTIEFVMFMGEEQGLLGSKAYIAEALQHKTIGRVRFMLNYDMANDPKGFASTQENCRGLFQSIGAMARQLDSSFQNSFRVAVGLHSDHESFMLRGIPTGGGDGGQLPNNSLRCYHADCDNFDLVDEKGLQNNVRFNAMLLYGLADTPVWPARNLSDPETKAFLIKNNLKTQLVLGGGWRWRD